MAAMAEMRVAAVKAVATAAWVAAAETTAAVARVRGGGARAAAGRPAAVWVERSSDRVHRRCLRSG